MRSTLIFLILIASPVWALEAYYGEDLAHFDGAPSTKLKIMLFEVLNGNHVQTDAGPDKIKETCPSETRCSIHTAIGYDSARAEMFGRLYLQKRDSGYAVPDLYCNDVLEEKDFPKGAGPGPGKIPSPNVMNTEHAWPQSRFSKKFPKPLQKSDLHILFPVSSRTNSLRGNHPYGMLEHETSQVCAESALGMTHEGTTAFTPPTVHRGKFARAVFYFATRYKMVINDEQEATLRQWHHEDPVTADERQRNDEVFALQLNRNPYIDHPEWVDAVPNF